MSVQFFSNLHNLLSLDLSRCNIFAEHLDLLHIACTDGFQLCLALNDQVKLAHVFFVEEFLWRDYRLVQFSLPQANLLSF